MTLAEEQIVDWLDSACPHSTPSMALFRSGCGTCWVEKIRAAVEEEREACAKLIDARCSEVLARQYGKAAYAFQTDVDTQIRMVTVLLPDLAAAIRARGRQ